jgi:hypothetical protein
MALPSQVKLAMALTRQYRYRVMLAMMLLSLASDGATETTLAMS